MIRGYDDGSIYAVVPNTPRETGPIDYRIDGPSTRSVRGAAMAVMNLELTMPVVAQQIYGLLFYDAGNVWARPTQIRPFADMFTAVGFGVRIQIPGMGMMGFDFAWPYRGVNKGKVKPHFQFGSSF